MNANPFHPTFGVSPPLLVGRGTLIDEFADGLTSGPGSPDRASLYTGLRGAGKTVLLNAIEDRAREFGWTVISETVSRGLVERLTTDRFPRILADRDPEAVKRHLAGLTLPLNLGGVSLETSERHEVVAGLRSQLELLTDILDEDGVGVLITLDEVHRQAIDDLRDVFTVIQHAFREDRQVAFAAAGLASAISTLLNDDVLTFLRRAVRHSLGPVSDRDVRRALEQPILDAGRTIGEAALDVLVTGTSGYPFMIQLVGFHAWKVHPKHADITVEDATFGVQHARRRLGQLVHEPALDHLSNVDRSFLIAMCEDDGPSRMADIADRMSATASYASQYRLRLIAAELIEPAGHGRVRFAMPSLRDYLREHVASDA